MSDAFIAHRLAQALKQANQPYLFERPVLDTYGTETPDTTEVVTLLGLYHSSSSRVTIVSGDSAAVQSKQSPMIFCKYADTIGIKQRDLVTIGTDLYRVNGVDNIQNLSVAADVSIEKVI